ncbi:MAG: phenylacetate--CoA ligase family protein [Candidatus Bathyarchaeota archaeon]|nr:MAG: phenylacetate--CoA ligase family protein [Candidatus Bathyarchaeota archaeon]
MPFRQRTQIKRFIHKSFSRLGQAKGYFDLKKSQWLARPKLKKIQEKKLRNIIKHAYNNVEYYHALFKSLNLHPTDVKNVDDLCKIPILTRLQIQKDPEKIIAHDADRKRCITSRTSGSTGRPLVLTFDDDALINRGSRSLRHFFESGCHLNDKIVRFTSPSRSLRSRTHTPWFNQLGFLRRKHLSVLDKIDNNISSLLAYSPDVIEGYPSTLWLIANTVQDKQIEGINPRIVCCTAELLPQDVRKKINSAFEVELFDQYGSVEFGTFAWECQEHNGYHMDIESVVVEFLRNGENVSPEEKGEIVVSGLFNLAMPLIRYSLGDIGRFSTERCSCGRGLPLMKIIDGRTDDFLVLPSGTIISPRNINLLEYVDGIAAYRIVQKERDKLEVQVVADSGFSPETISRTRDRILRGCLGEDIEINVEIVDEIPRDISGKMRSVVSEVKKTSTTQSG